MKEHQILFSGDMVRAILEGKKTQTRRVVRQNYIYLVEEVLRINGKWVFDTIDYELTTPYGRPGDRLWVRETWAIDGCGCRVSLSPEAWPEGWPLERLQYAADIPTGKHFINFKRPSIYMPRWASRITLEVTNIRVERLQEISKEDAIEEGIPNAAYAINPIKSFELLWNSINAKRGLNWETNPWVWVIEFKRLHDYLAWRK